MAGVPEKPRLYHIVHVDRLASIVADGCLWSDSEAIRRQCPGTTVGMGHIKERRLKENQLDSHPRLYVGQCVPFYFCPRSIMLYLFWMNNHPDLTYDGGQEPIVHLVFDLRKVVAWADSVGKRWAFTLSNAGSRYFEDRADLDRLKEIDWNAVGATDFRQREVKENKQAEFLVEGYTPWDQVIGIAVYSKVQARLVEQTLADADHQPKVKVLRKYYYL